MTGARSHSAEAAAPPSRTSGLLYGLGLGGFVDGILLHEVLQWHHMVSSEYPTDTVAGLEVNTLADGLFHVATWFLVLAASIAALVAWLQAHLKVLPAQLAPTPPSQDQQVRGVHHVRDDLGGPLSWDIGFLVLGALLVIGGWLLHLSGRRPE